jgi:hypothetical protein
VVGAVELRHRDWFAGRLQGRTLALLERLELAHVVVDAPPGFASSVPWVPAVTHPRLAVVRLHGRRTETWERPVAVVSERYRYRYAEAELAALVPDIDDVARRTQGVHVIFNNCHGDYGTRNAAEMAELLARRDALRRRLVHAPEPGRGAEQQRADRSDAPMRDEDDGARPVEHRAGGPRVDGLPARRHQRSRSAARFRSRCSSTPRQIGYITAAKSRAVTSRTTTRSATG